jgi:hypothetical protein
MRVVKAGTKEDPYGEISLCYCIGDFDFFVFHRPGWCYRPKALSRVRDVSIPPIMSARPKPHDFANTI